MTLQEKEKRLLAEGQQHNSSSKINIKKKKKTVENSGAQQLILQMQDAIHTPERERKTQNTLNFAKVNSLFHHAKCSQRLATGWTVRGSNPGGGEIFRTYPDRPCGPPSHLYNGHRVFPEG